MDNGYCSGLCNAGWTFNIESGYWVCGKCGKPSRAVGLRECAFCEKLFVPSRYVDPEYEVTHENGCD